MTSTNDLSRDHHVSLRRQLAVGLEAAIRDGHLGPGSRLPSTREIAGRLGLHRSTVTAAYARLRRRGWITGGPGGHLRVRSPSADVPAGTETGPIHVRPPGTDAPAARLARDGVGRLLAEARRAGLNRQVVARSAIAMASCVAEPVARPGGPFVILFEPRAGLRAVLAGELERRLRIRVSARGLFPAVEACAGAPILVRSELRDRTSARWPGGIDTIGLQIAGGTRERGLVRRAARGGLVTLLSVSRTVRRYAGELAAREFGRGISFVAVSPFDSPAVYRSVAASRLVLFDEPSREHAPRSRAPSHAVRLLTETQMTSLRAYLGAPGEDDRGIGRAGRPLDRPGT